MSTRGRVRGLIKALGAVRDCDVQLGFLEKTLASLDRRGSAQAFEPVRARLERAAQPRRAHGCCATLDSPPVRAFMRDWREHLAAATPGSTRAQRASPAVIARDLIRDQARKLRKRARRLDDERLRR